MIMHWKSISQINRIVTRSMKKVVIWHNNEDNDNDEIWLIDSVFSSDQEMWSDMWWKGELWSCKKLALNRLVKTLFGSLGPLPPPLVQVSFLKKKVFLLLPLIENIFAGWNQRLHLCKSLSASLLIFVANFWYHPFITESAGPTILSGKFQDKTSWLLEDYLQTNKHFLDNHK